MQNHPFHFILDILPQHFQINTFSLCTQCALTDKHLLFSITPIAQIETQQLSLLIPWTRDQKRF